MTTNIGTNSTSWGDGDNNSVAIGRDNNGTIHVGPRSHRRSPTSARKSACCRSPSEVSASHRLSLPSQRSRLALKPSVKHGPGCTRQQLTRTEPSRRRRTRSWFVSSDSRSW